MDSGRTGIEPVRVWHARGLLEARKGTEIDRPLAQLHDLALYVTCMASTHGRSKREDDIDSLASALVLRSRGKQEAGQEGSLLRSGRGALAVLTSSVYRMICSESEVYSVATNMRSKIIRVSREGAG